MALRHGRWHPPAVDRSHIDRITEVQHSLITTDQFVTATGSVSALRWALKDEWLLRYENWRGVYIVAGAPRTPFQPHMAAALLGGPASAASGFSAGWLWNSPDIAEAPPELTVFCAPARRIRHVRVRRSHLDASSWTTRRHAIPVVNGPLLVVQLAQEGAGYLAERVADDLFKRRVTGPAAILRCLEVTGCRQRGTPALQAFCERALSVRGHDDSPAARDLGAALVAAGVPAFVTQQYVPVDGHDYFLDFAWPSEMVGLEYAGWRDHGATRSAFDRDAARRNRLVAAGWRILDATSAASHDAVIRWVFATLTDARFRS